MLITKITLENIKSYRHATIPLDRGTTAIRGHNGAGKSTIVEAIGYALFDFLPYSPAARFIREGEKSGKVVVSLVSVVDERPYDIERRISQSGSGAWFAVDAELGKRVVEGKDDMLAFLREHLGVESTLPLAELYDNAIAVQQGTFTADFLQTASVRKKKFDNLLQVEDYTQAFNTLRETVSYLKDTLAGRQADIERLNAQTADLPAWHTEQTALHATIAQLSERMGQLVDERDTAEKAHNAAQTLQAEVTRLAQAQQQARNAADLARLGWQTAQDAADQAAKARARCAAALPDHQRHLAAQRDLAQAQADQQQANTLKLHQARAEQTLHATRQSLAAAQDRVAQAQNAAAERDRLAPMVARQQELETQLQAASQAQQQLPVVQREQAQTATDIQQQQQELQQAQTEIARLEALQPLAEALTVRRQRLDHLRQEAAMHAERAQRLQALHAQIAQQERHVATTAAAADAARAQVEQTRALRGEIAILPAREAALAQMHDAIASLTAEIKHAETSMHASQGGTCPFLKEPCLNMRQRGMANLEEYFGNLVATKVDALHPHERERAALQEQIAHLRAAQAQVEQLPAQEQAAQAARVLRDEQQAELSRRQQDYAELSASLRDADDLQSQITEAQKLVTESNEADKQCVKLPTLRSQRMKAETQIAALTERQQEREHSLTGLRAAAATAPALTAALSNLGDPRQQHALHQANAQQLPTIQQEVAQLQAAIVSTQTELARLTAQLAPFADLPDRIAGLQAQISATQTAHDDYLRHETLAAQLPAATERAAAARSQLAAAETALAAATQAYDAAHAQFDPAALAAIQQRLHDLNEEWGMVKEQSSQARARVTALATQIAEGEARLSELAEIRAAFSEEEATLSQLQYFRDTIKEAGPFVMRALLREISGAANRIFGEIMGDRAATLIWQEDYDIILRTTAYERHFAQLSGGEQMSAALAVRLALLHTLTRARVAFFDEPTQNMDDERRTNLATQIQRVSGFDQLVVISHDDTFEEGLDSVVWVRKHEGASQVDSDGKASIPLAAIAFSPMLGA